MENNNQYQNQFNQQSNNQLQEMNQNQNNQQINNNKKRRNMYIAGPLILLIALVGVTYAFFNYTRTGTANNIRTGRIYFNTSQNGTLNLTNLFPVASSEVGSSNDEITVRIQGDTTYTGGEEFEISLVSVNNSITSGSTEKAIPINYIATYERTPVATGETPNNIGTSSNDYFTERGSTTAVYQLNAAGEVSEGKQVLVGYIPKDVAIDGTLTIKAYLDGSNIAISDTYPSGDVTHIETSGETSVEVVDYTDGTTSEWVNGRTVLTTTEWNTLQTMPISFKIKAESNEGIWVEELVVIPTIASCPGCKFIYTENEYFYSANNYNSSPISTLTTFENNNETLVDDYTTLNKNYFLGFKFDGNGVITNAYACGIKGTDYLNDEEQTPGVNAGTAFCVEGSTDGSTYSATNTFLNDSTTGIWQGRCGGNGSFVSCNGSVLASASSYGNVYVADGGGRCDVNYGGNAGCH